MKEIIDIVHKSILPFFDVCEKEEEPLTEKDKLLLKVNKAICNNLKALEQKQKTGWIPVSERLPESAFGCLVTVYDTDLRTQDEFENILPYFVGYDGKTWNDADGEPIPFEVIAWMPLPPSYQKVESEETK